MRFLRKISPSPYADSTHSVVAYSRDGLGFEIAEPDATYVAPPPDPRLEAIGDAHEDALTRVAGMTIIASDITYKRTKSVPITILVGVSVATARTYHDCYASCHNQNPPVQPPVPEIKTDDDDDDEVTTKTKGD